MNTHEDIYNTHAILFVDDEQQTLKYFEKAFSAYFRIMTAQSAEEARRIIEDSPQEIGVLITDQRMPKQTGVDLLDQVRQSYPGIVRILTTAYADLDSAVQAVNEGAVFRYVTKPWNIHELRGVLKNAMDFFLLQRERDVLMKEKIHALHRILLLDRTRSWSIIVACLGRRINHATPALKRYVDLALTCNLSSSDTFAELDLWMIGPEEIKKFIASASDIFSHLSFSECISDFSSIDVEQLLGDAVRQSSQKDSFKINVIDKSPHVKANHSMISKGLVSMVNCMARSSEQSQTVQVTLSKSTVRNVNGVRIDMNITDGRQMNEKATEFYRGLYEIDNKNGLHQMEAMSVFFAAYHHCGEVTMDWTSDELKWSMQIPCSADEVDMPADSLDWIDDVFLRMEQPTEVG